MKRRVRKIRRAADLVLCLFPFEPDFFKDHQVSATYVGHPMADQISTDLDPAPARDKLGLVPDAETVALLPGSRTGEVSRLAQPMIEAARILQSKRPGLQFVAAMANGTVRDVFQKTMDQLDFSVITLVENAPRTVIAAADAVMCASGTATLETMLVNRPMVVAYRISDCDLSPGQNPANDPDTDVCPAQYSCRRNAGSGTDPAGRDQRKAG